LRIVLQRVSKASVTVDEKTISSIDNGLLLLLGITQEDNFEDIQWLARKIVNLRIFNDEYGVMNKSVLDIEGDIIVVSQFTLYASTKKGNRPSYIKAAKPDMAISLYESFVSEIQGVLGKKVVTGIFGANMQVTLVNDGPVTITIDSKNKE